MVSTLLPAGQWAQMEFCSAKLGDARRTRRLVEVATALATKPTGALPQALPDWADLKAAYRLFSNEEISHERILSPHWQRTLQSCSGGGEYLIVEDTTVLDFSSRRAMEGLGPVGSSPWALGMMVHSTLALRVDAWDLEQKPEVTVAGLLDQHCWVRPPERLNQPKQRKRILRRARESQRWARWFERQKAPAQGQWTFVADRECDIYEAFVRCHDAGVDFVIRASHPRALCEADQNVFSAMQVAPVRGTFELELRSRVERAARTVKLEVRSTSVTLRGTWRPGGRTAPFELNVVFVREVGATDKEALQWGLLTSLPCERFIEAQRIVCRYAQRWLIEEYHKALKTGAQIERSQLSTAQRIQSMLAVCAVVAVRLLNTKLLSKAHPDRPVHAQAFGPELIELLTARFGQPSEGWTYQTLLVAIARLGGFLARARDGDPGWLTIWRGWRELQTMAEGLRLIRTCG